jgi:hypothetical protein
MKYLYLALVPVTLFCSWSSQWHAAAWYEHFMPVEMINTTYHGYYPYWGYGLGMGKTLDELAQQQNWQSIGQKLMTEKNMLHARGLDARLIALRLKRINAHLAGIGL